MRARGTRGKPARFERLVAAGVSLHLDAVTTEVVLALREAGIPSVLLRGPAIARWLYEDPTERSYVDTDLLGALDDLLLTRLHLDSWSYHQLLVLRRTDEG
jgi:Uncharacterised nucleotidyltransferase